MPLDLTRRDRVFIGAIYGIPIVVLIAALAMAFNHAKDWAGRHNDGPSWEHWTFAAVIELPALLGLLLLTLWPKIGGGRKPTVPRVLFGSAAALSMFVQQAYAGPAASVSERFVAALPSIGAGVFLELVFWVMGLIDNAKTKAAEEVEQAALKQTRRALGLGDIAPPPTLTSPVVSTPTPAPVTVTPAAMSPDMSTPTPEPVSPDMRAEMTPDIDGPAPRHDTVTLGRGDGDIPQVNDRVTPPVGHGNPWADITNSDPDSSTADRVAIRPDVTPIATGNTDMSPDTELADSTPDVTPTPGEDADDVTPDDGDMSADTDAKRMSDPRWPEAAEMRRNGATVKAIAAHFSVTTRTVTRWKLPEPNTAQPANGRVPHLTGANR